MFTEMEEFNYGITCITILCKGLYSQLSLLGICTFLVEVLNVVVVLSKYIVKGLANM